MPAAVVLHTLHHQLAVLARGTLAEGKPSGVWPADQPLQNYHSISKAHITVLQCPTVLGVILAWEEKLAQV